MKMLIRFKVGNFLSFDEPQELSMISGETRNHLDHIHRFENINILRTSAIYGANASGKSNLIKAFKESKQMITMGRPIHSNKYFRPSVMKKDKPSYFEYEFENGGKYYSYGFEFLPSKQKIESEWLYELEPERENRVFFQRTGNKIDHSFEGDDRTRMDIYAADMQNSDSTLFLREMNRKTRKDEKGLSVFSDVFRWFSQSMKVFNSEVFLYDKPKFTKDEKEIVVGLLRSLDTGITDICYELVENVEDFFPERMLNEIQEELIRNKNKNSENDGSFIRGSYFLSLSEDNDLIMKKLVFKHGSTDVSFDMEEESEGTQRLYELLAMIVSKEEDSVYILDELDLKLHPLLTFKFVDMFLNRKAGTKNQLIFTCHESNLMDFELLRRDEIWFVQKNEDESSSLYSLEDFNERTDRKIDKAYLEGRYGGVPIFSTLFPVSSCDRNEAEGK
ncbi:MAG: ATP-binding protein [Candidatus Methanoplasma sp.]|jgi:AAA15 family ATPase/GTPase|nr:ATP-binding protein [Candidatus Methanoplasma sp.]